MIDKDKKINDFLTELTAISKKHGVWLGNYWADKVVLQDGKMNYLGVSWPVEVIEKPFNPYTYDWK